MLVASHWGLLEGAFSAMRRKQFVMTCTWRLEKKDEEKSIKV
jgi:hypothetical protein